MEISIYVRGIHEHEATKLSSSIRNYINEAISKLEELADNLHGPIFLNLTVTAHKPHPHHEVDLRIHGPQLEIIVKKEGPELYKIIDEVLDETLQQIIKHKDKEISDKKQKNRIK